MSDDRAVTARRRRGLLLAACLLSVAGGLRAADATSRHDVLVVIGAPGATEYEAGFAAAAEQWRAACVAAGAACTVIGATPADPAAASDRDAVAAWFGRLDPEAARPAWFVFIGHGTFDGREARLNLRGTDLTGSELKALVAALGERPAVIVHGGSASGPLVPLLSAPHRVVVTATTSGDEVNYARFGEKFAAAIGGGDGSGDLDMDGQVSVLEAFVAAARGVELFYSGEGRLATEHALIDDNGDARGTPADFFRGTRLVRRAAGEAAADGAFARRIALLETPEERALTDDQRRRRDALEDELEALRARKDGLAEADYLRDLERILRALGGIYGEAAAPDS